MGLHVNWALLVAIAWAITAMFQKRLLIQGVLPGTMLLLVSFISGLILAAVAIVLLAGTGSRSHFNSLADLRSLPFRAWMDVLVVAVVGFVCAYWVMLLVIKKNGIARGIPLAYTTPLFTLLLGTIAFGERVTSVGVMGALMIVVGGVVLSMSSGENDE